MGLAFDGLLGIHIIFALIWIGASFISARSVMGVIKSPADANLRKRALMSQTLVAAAGGLTVLIGVGFYYYVNYYRTSYAPSSAGLPLIDAGALLGIIVFAWQMAMGPRIRRGLGSSMNSNSGGSTTPVQTTNTAMPKGWMVLLPAILLILAFLLMIGGSMM